MGHKESDKTEWLSLSLSFFLLFYVLIPEESWAPGNLALLRLWLPFYFFIFCECWVEEYQEYMYAYSVMSNSLRLHELYLPGSSVHGIFLTRILEWIAISPSRGSPNPGIKPTSPALAGWFFTTEPLGKPLNMKLPSKSRKWTDRKGMDEWRVKQALVWLAVFPIISCVILDGLVFSSLWGSVSSQFEWK